jgi:tight adherence protein B
MHGIAMTGLAISGLAIVLAVLAALLAVSRPTGRAVASRLGTTQPRRTVKSGLRRWPVALAAGLAGIVTTFVATGPRVAVVALTVLIIACSVLRLVELHHRAGAALRSRREVAYACSVLASQLRVGRVATEALSSSAEDCPILAGSARTLELGGDPVPIWRSLAGRPGWQGLGDLARAWQVSHQTGAPLAPALEQVAAALADDAAIRQVVAGEVSAPRATAKIMAVLPFFGIAIGYAIGGKPLSFLLSGPFGWACLIGGVTLAAAGIAWIERLARSVAEQG